MPRITEPTVAEHHAKQRRRLTEAAREIVLAEGIERLSFGRMAERTGLARPSVYSYFSSVEEALLAVCQLEFQAMNSELEESLGSLRSPKQRVTTWVRAQLERVANGERHLLNRISASLLGKQVSGQLAELQDALLPPLAAAYADLGERDALLAATITQGAVDAAARRIESGDDAKRTIRKTVAFALNGYDAK